MLRQHTTPFVQQKITKHLDTVTSFGKAIINIIIINF